MARGSWRTRIPRAALTAALGVALVTPAGAQCRQFLYWSKTPVFADNVNTCFSRVVAAVTQSGFTGIRRNEMEVAGSKRGTYVSVTCIATQPRATALVMTVGGNEAETIRVRDELTTKVARTQGL